MMSACHRGWTLPSVHRPQWAYITCSSTSRQRPQEGTRRPESAPQCPSLPVAAAGEGLIGDRDSTKSRLGCGDAVRRETKQRRTLAALDVEAPELLQHGNALPRGSTSTGQGRAGEDYVCKHQSASRLANPKRLFQYQPPCG